MKIKSKTIFTTALFCVTLYTPLSLSAQVGARTSVAVISLWGDEKTIVREFEEEVIYGVESLPGYRPVFIDRTDWPPPGLFEERSPIKCPSPSLIRNMPYALTSEIYEEYDTGGWAMRLYLWQMDGTRLIYSDSMVAFDRETCRMILPGLLEFMFSFVFKDSSR